MFRKLAAIIGLVLVLTSGCATIVTYKGKEVVRAEINPRGAKLTFPQTGTTYGMKTDLDWLLEEPDLAVKVERPTEGS